MRFPDNPFMIYDARKGEVKVLCGQGVAPLDTAAIGWYMRNGIPPRGESTPKNATLPGAMSLFFKALELYGVMSFEQVAQPALGILDRGGQPWYTAAAAMLRKLIATEKSAAGSREQKLQAARDRFYKGDIADALDAWLRANGGFLRKADFAAYQTPVEDPVRYVYKGYTINKCNTWTQGPFLLQSLALLSRADLHTMGLLSADYIHYCTEAMKLAFADRDKFYGDPLFVHVPLDTMLSTAYTNLRFPLIDPRHASTEVRPGDPFHIKALSSPDSIAPWIGGTTTCCVADAYGNLVAATPSANPSYTQCRSLGVTFATRLTSLNTQAGHPNCIRPGKRPRVTLTPTIVTRNGKPVIAISVAGSDMQDQVTMQLLLDFIEFGLMPADAVTRPRFETMRHEDSFIPNPNWRSRMMNGNLEVNTSIDAAVRTTLAARGHTLSTNGGFIAYPTMVYLDGTTGSMYAAGDPAAGRTAGALTQPTKADSGPHARGGRIGVTGGPDGIRIAWDLTQAAPVSIAVHTLQGRLVDTWHFVATAGAHETAPGPRHGAAGCYVVKTRIGNGEVASTCLAIGR